MRPHVDDQVSIPRSEFWSFGRGTPNGVPSISESFNSSVGILVVRTRGGSDSKNILSFCFNSSVGILVVRTRHEVAAIASIKVCFNSSVGILVVRTPASGDEDSINERVSIPRSEFWSFGRDARRLPHRRSPGFNSSVGILVVRTSPSH